MIKLRTANIIQTLIIKFLRIKLEVTTWASCRQLTDSATGKTLISSSGDLFNMKYQERMQQKAALSPVCLNRNFSPLAYDENQITTGDHQAKIQNELGRLRTISRERSGHDTEKVCSILQNQLKQRENLLREFEIQQNDRQAFSPKPNFRNAPLTTISDTIGSERNLNSPVHPVKSISSIVSDISRRVDYSKRPVSPEEIK